MHPLMNKHLLYRVTIVPLYWQVIMTFFTAKVTPIHNIIIIILGTVGHIANTQKAQPMEYPYS